MWPILVNAQSVNVIINEIMADPEPVIGLEAVEYVELRNAGSGPVELKGHIWKDRSTQVILDDFVLMPGEFLILCALSDTLQLKNYGPVMGLHPWPRLNNSDDDIELWSAEGELLDHLSYQRSWYGNSSKDDGGFSLERIHAYSWCGPEANWIASLASEGGTPGRENSVSSQDLSVPSLLNAIAQDSIHIRLDFDEAVSPASSPQVQIDPAIPISGISVGFNSDIYLQLDKPLTAGIRYRIAISHVADCSGNLAVSEQQAFFYLPEAPQPGDLVINEVLFNPWSGGSDFVELYNCSTRHLNIKEWMIGNYQDSLVGARKITEHDFLVSPGDHLVLSPDLEDVKRDYPSSRTSKFLRTQLPALSNEQGSLALAKPDGTLMDSMIYSSSYHYPLLREVEGVSLERLDARANSMDKHNWRSAAESVGFASPGFLNSQSAPENQELREVQILPGLILPENNGNQDYTRILYSFQKGGNVAKVQIMDINGNHIKTLAQNQYLGNSGFFTWDGTDWRSRKVKPGHYLVYFQVFHADGSKKSWMGKVAVAPRF